MILLGGSEREREREREARCAYKPNPRYGGKQIDGRVVGKVSKSLAFDGLIGFPIVEAELFLVKRTVLEKTRLSKWIPTTAQQAKCAGSLGSFHDAV